MKKNKDNEPILTKIEVDEKTNIPSIKPLSKKQAKKAIADNEKAKDYHEYDFVSKKSDKTINKQMAMERVFGVNPEEENISKRQKTLKYVFIAIFLVFVLSVLAITFYDDFFSSSETLPTWAVIKETIQNCWWYVIFGLLCIFLMLLFKGTKLSIMAKSTTKKWHFTTCFETAIIGCYYNNVTPLAVGGQPFEIYHLSKHGVHGGVASSLPIVSFFLTQFAFVIMSIISLVLYTTNSFHAPTFITDALPITLFYTLAIIGIICCLMMPLTVLLFCLFPRVCSKLVGAFVKIGAKLHLIKTPEQTLYKTLKNVIHNSKCIKKIAKNFWVLSSATLLSFCEQLALVSTSYFAMRTFGFDIKLMGGFNEWLVVCQISFILLSAVSFIPTPGNSGAADGFFYIFFSSCVMSGFTFLSMVLWRFLSFYSFILIGFIFANLKKKSDAKKLALSTTLPPNE